MDPSVLPPVRPVQCSRYGETQAKKLCVHLGSVPPLCCDAPSTCHLLGDVKCSPSCGLLQATAPFRDLSKLLVWGDAAALARWPWRQRGAPLCPATHCSAHLALAPSLTDAPRTQPGQLHAAGCSGAPPGDHHHHHHHPPTLPATLLQRRSPGSGAASRRGPARVPGAPRSRRAPAAPAGVSARGQPRPRGSPLTWTCMKEPR